MGHALYYPRQNIRFHCQPGNNATPRSRVLFSIIIRQVCMKLANCAESAHQFFFFSKLSLLHETHSCPTKKTILSESRMIEERRLHLVCSPRVCDRNRRSIKKKKSEGSQFARTNWAKCFLIDFIGARETTPLPPPS